LEDTPYDGSWFGVSGTGEAGGVIAWGLRGNVFRSDDFGDTWQEVTLMTPSNGPLESTLAGGGLTPDGRLVIVGVRGAAAISEAPGAASTCASAATGLLWPAPQPWPVTACCW